MKKTSLIIPVVLMVVPAVAQAQDAAAPASSPFTVLYTIIGLLIGILVFQAWVMRRLTVLIREQQYRIETGMEMPSELPEASVAAGQKDDLFTQVYKELTRVNRAGKEKDVMLEHDYDGIRELDNIMPPWLTLILYVTILFAVGYWLVYHVYDIGKLPKEEYAMELQRAEAQKLERLKLVGASVDENSVKQLTDAAAISEGKTIFTARCAACHGQAGEGAVGPNLTDNYWIHGGSLNDIFKTVKYGVPAKGMVPWQGVLKPDEMQTVVSFIMSINGSNPPNQKEPQGTLYTPQAAPADTAAVKADSAQVASDTTRMKGS